MQSPYALITSSICVLFDAIEGGIVQHSQSYNAHKMDNNKHPKTFLNSLCLWHWMAVEEYSENRIMFIAVFFMCAPMGDVVVAFCFVFFFFSFGDFQFGVFQALRLCDNDIRAIDQ